MPGAPEMRRKGGAVATLDLDTVYSTLAQSTTTLILGTMDSSPRSPAWGGMMVRGRVGSFRFRYRSARPCQP